jgi:hypothetical protein
MTAEVKTVLVVGATGQPVGSSSPPRSNMAFGCEPWRATWTELGGSCPAPTLSSAT